jgi:sugar lactone lactonase YvrE
MKHLITLTTTLLGLLTLTVFTPAADPPANKYIPATAHCVPKETATEGEGYFAIIEGLNKKLYIGTHANAVNSWLVEFDPAEKKMNVVVDAHKAIGTDLKGFGSQAKIHTRNNTGASGKIYFGTKQGYPSKEEKRTDYPGGYPMVYDPKTGDTKVYPIPVKHQGINSITPDESRGVAYISTCSDERPTESAHFLVLDLKTGNTKDLIDTKHMYGFIVVDWKGRAYHPMLGGEIARYTPAEKGGIEGGKLELLKQTIDGQAPSKESLLADPKSHPINWDITPDGKTIYCVAMSNNQLFSYDLTAEGNTIPGKSHGSLVAGAKNFDCRALCVGPTGEVWAAVTEAAQGVNLAHLVRYRAGDKTPSDLGVIEVTNPNFTEFKDKTGKDLPYHGGLAKLADGKTTTRHVLMGVCQAREGQVYVLALHPYMVLQVQPPK